MKAQGYFLCITILSIYGLCGIKASESAAPVRAIQPVVAIRNQLVRDLRKIQVTYNGDFSTGVSSDVIEKFKELGSSRVSYFTFYQACKDTLELIEYSDKNAQEAFIRFGALNSEQRQHVMTKCYDAMSYLGASRHVLCAERSLLTKAIRSLERLLEHSRKQKKHVSSAVQPVVSK